jgi:cilia- and flagella-associated protein 298
LLKLTLNFQLQVDANIPITVLSISEALHQLRGAVMVVYPMELPPHDPCYLTKEDCDNVTGIVLEKKEVW